MSPVSNKHSNAQRVFYSGFDGGLNLSVPNEALPKNELKEAMNVEFSPLTGCMKVRGGLVWSGRFGVSGISGNKIVDVVPVVGRKGFIVKAQGTDTPWYFRWTNILKVSGSISRAAKMSIVSWRDNEDKECWLIAAGGMLTKFTDNLGPKIEYITNAPLCKLVFVRENRIGVVTNDDQIRFSAFGDCENWTNDPEDESSAQFLNEIGYKDGMKIDAVVPLSKDLIIFKSPEGEPDKGIIYRLTGEYPDWQVVEVAHNTGTFSQQSVCVVGSDIYYATVAGIATLSTVTSYGEVRTAWPDRKVNNALTPELGVTARIFNVPVKQQLWVQPNADSKKIWVFDYTRGIWTTFEFPKVITYAVGVDNSLYVFIDADIYEVNDSYTQDELREANNTSKMYTITAKMKLGTLLNGMQTLIKGAFASFNLMPSCKAELVLGKYKMKFTYPGSPEDYIYGDPADTSSNYYQYASDDDDPLFSSGGVLTSRQRFIVRDWAITPEINIEGGGCSVSTIGLEIAEV